MNKEAKLKELELRQRDIADEIQKLREAEGEHVPVAGDVYNCASATGGRLDMLISDDYEVVLHKGGRAISEIYNLGRHKIMDPVFLGTFSDVYMRRY